MLALLQSRGASFRRQAVRHFAKNKGVPQLSSCRKLTVLPDNAVVTSCGTKLHPLWLRERCSGPASVQWETVQPLQQPHDIPEDLSIIRASVRNGGGGWSAQLMVEFSDGHRSLFDADYLEAESQDFMSHGIQQVDIRLPKERLWDRDSGANVQRFDHAQVIDAHPEAAFNLTTALLRDGHVIVEGVPCNDKELISFAKSLIGFQGETAVRPTNWGEVFNVRSQPDGKMKDLAYTSEKLFPHVDNPYRNPTPGFQLLHVLENECSTGDNFAVDGFKVAMQLRDEDPEAYKSLSSISCRWENDGGDRSTALIHFAPYLTVDGTTGELTQIRYSPKSGGYPPSLPCEKQMTKFYQARRRLAQLLNDESNTVRFKLRKGDMWIFNNLRVLHGRTEFNPNEGARFLQGAYIDMDGVTSAYYRSKFAMMHRKRKRTDTPALSSFMQLSAVTGVSTAHASP